MPKVTRAKIEDLTPDNRNANKGTQRGGGLLEKSLRQYGAGRSILLDKNNRIIAGNKTAGKALEIGIDDVIIVETNGRQVVAVKRTDLDLDSEEARMLAYADNQVGAASLDFDVDVMQIDFDAGLPLDEFFRPDEFDDLGLDWKEEPADDPGADIDRAEELREKWQTATGQLWIIPSATGDGEHRIICGDCTDAAVVARVMGGEKAKLTWTDPPYGVDYGAKLDASNAITHRVRSIQNDDLPPEKLEAFVRSALVACADASIPGASVYVASPPGTLLPKMIGAFSGSGFDFRWHLVWLKDQIVLSRADYHFKHENILYGWKGDAAHYFIDDRKQASVFEYDRPKKSEEHPTMKPVELVEHMVKNSSRSNDVIIDPFLGSGTTAVAAERLARQCRGVEISPAYVAVSLERLAQMGLEPYLAIPENPESVNDG